MKSRTVRPGIILAGILLGVTLTSFFPALPQEEMEVQLTSETDYAKVAAQISAPEITETVQQLASLGSRVTGYPGCDQAADLVEKKFREFGLQNVTVDPFPVMAPVVPAGQAPATLQVGGKVYTIYPLWPNLVRTPQTPPEGISGPLVNGGSGEFKAFNGSQVIGSLVLMDFNCQQQWLNAAILGARAVLFAEPETTVRGEAEQKFLSIPADIPRYWVPRALADSLRGMVKSQGPLPATVHCGMKWREVTAKNISGVIEGTDPELKNQRIVIEAYYDSMSVVPSLSPGAEEAASMAAMFQLIKAFQVQPPKRTVVFLASGAHFEGLAGAKRYVWERVRGARADGYVKYCVNVAKNTRKDIEDLTSRLWAPAAVSGQGGLEPPSVSDQMRSLGNLLDRVRAAGAGAGKLATKTRRGLSIKDPNRGKLLIYQLPAAELERRQKMLQAFAASVPIIRQAASQAETVIRQAQKVPANDEAGQEQALAQVKMAVSALTRALDVWPEDADLWFSVDLSSHNQAFGIFYKAYFYDTNENNQWKFSDVGKKAREYASLIGQALSVDPDQRFADGINALQGKTWQAYMSGHLALGNEVTNLAGIPGLGFATINDSRPYVDTPLDVPEHMDGDNVAEQARFLACMLCDLVSVNQPADLYKITLDDNLVEARGRLVQFNPAKSTFPDEPVVGGIATIRQTDKTDMGVRTEFFDQTDEKGLFDLVGIPNIRALTAPPLPVEVDGFLPNPRDGSIMMAPDRGVNGAVAYPIQFPMDMAVKATTVVMFNCKPMTIFETIDQRYYDPLQQIYVYDADLEAEPYAYGYDLPKPGRKMVSTYEPVSVVYAAPGTRLRVTMSASLLGLRFLLLNPTPDRPAGVGYLIDDTPTMYLSPYLVARDMWTLDEDRIQTLRKYGITNNLVDEAHGAAKEQLALANQSLLEQRYDVFITAARSAWSLESRAYPAVRTTANDVIKGIIFYLALLLPFSFFMERLMIGHPDLKWQLLSTGGIFLVIFIILDIVHPAFALVYAPIVILLAFIILTLALLVISIIAGKFEEQMKAIRYEQTGMHSADVGRLGASAAAFGLGVSNMRRRKVRTVLTCLTLILLTFTVMSFTSVVQSVRANKILMPRLALYNGVLVRDKTWLPMGEIALDEMRTEFGPSAAVAGRAWYYSTDVGKQSFVNVSRGAKTYMAVNMMGMMPSEAQVSQPQQYLEGSKSRWFQEGDRQVCILPSGVASALGVTNDDVGTATVSVFGNQMRVIGILSSSRYKSAQDLDGEAFTPVDFLMLSQQTSNTNMEASRSGSARGGEMQYVHVAPDSAVLVPFGFAMDHNASLRSVAVATPTGTSAMEVLDSLVTRIELNLYAGVDGKTYLCSALGTTSFGGMTDLIIPILIAAAIVLNTMLGSVYERVKEIYIYSSLGLAPNHVAALFIAEASVYAVIGAIAGYLVGQAAAKVVMTFHLSSGLNLNYSSLSAVVTTIIIMATVLLSVLYPARRASDIAMPGIERRWALPEPEGDLLSMSLPFTVTGDQALGVNMYLREFFMAHTDYSLGQFSTGDIVLKAFDYENGLGYELAAMIWLAPYDLGVSEHLAIKTVPTEDPEIFHIDCAILRSSGDDASWKRVTRNFVNIIRKQYLLWRTFPAAQKAEYGQQATLLLSGELVEDETGAA